MLKILKNKYILSFIEGIAVIIIPFILNLIITDYGSYAKRIAQLLGGDILNGGYIQFFTYVALFIGLNDLKQRYYSVLNQEKAFTFQVLNTTAQFVYYENDILDVKHRAIAIDQENEFELITIIKKIATKFQRTKSVGEAIQFLDSIIDAQKLWVDGQYTLIRYTIWALPVLGFIGTIWGIGASLQLIRQSFNEAQLNILVSTLSVAFDTTLVALVLSMILVGAYYYVGNREEQLFVKIKNYILDNMINRIELLNEKDR